MCKYPELMVLRKRYAQTLKVGDRVKLRSYEDLKYDLGCRYSDEPNIDAGWCDDMRKILEKLCTIRFIDSVLYFRLAECAHDFWYSYDMFELDAVKKVSFDIEDKIGTIQDGILILPDMCTKRQVQTVEVVPGMYYINDYYIPTTLADKEVESS